MSIIHRRVLPTSETRCSPFPDCTQKSHCARHTSPISQGEPASVSNFANEAGWKDGECKHYLSQMQTDADATQAKDKPATKPPLGCALPDKWDTFLP